MVRSVTPSRNELRPELLETRLNLSTAAAAVSLLPNPYETALRSSLMVGSKPVAIGDFAVPLVGGSNSNTINWPSTLKTTCTPDAINLKWNDNSKNENGFEIWRSVDGKNYSLLTTTDANATTFSDTNVTGDVKYYYLVRAVNLTAQSNWSNGATGMLAPKGPTNFKSTNVTSGSVTLSWTDNSTGERGFGLYRSTDGINYKAVTNIGANGTTYTNTSLAAATKYYYKISSWNSYGETFSDPIVVTTANPLPPNAPSNVNFTNVSTNTLTVYWNDNSNVETGYHVFRSTDGVNFTQVANLGANSRSFKDSAVNPGTNYTYKISAWNVSGEVFSNKANVATQSLTPPPVDPVVVPVVVVPVSPTNLNFTDVTTNSLTLKWTDASANENGFKVYRSTDGVNYSVVKSLASGVTSYSESGLQAGVKYYYKVGAYNGAGEVLSTSATATTAAIVPPAPTPTPLPPPPAPTPTTQVATITTKNMTSFVELVIDGTSGNDSIYISQSNGVLTIVANGKTSTYNNTFGDIVVRGLAGDDSITIDSSVSIASLIYGGNGADTLTNKTTGKATIVDIDNSANYMTGNGVSTSFWANVGDTINASALEIANKAVNRVANWFQTNLGAVARSLDGQNLADPTDSGGVHRNSAASFWGTGPNIKDINQGSIGDCYYLATIASFANNESAKFTNTGVDLGDGTYAVRFQRGGTTTYVRVDGDLPNSYFQHAGASGNMWGAIYEKAYAFFRSNAGTYSSLNWGNPNVVMNDFGFSNSSLSTSATQAQMLQTITTALDNNRAVVALSRSSVPSGSPIIASHAYSVTAAWLDSSGKLMITVRNPWGHDGAGNDGNPGDALITVNYDVFATSFVMISFATA